MRIHLLAVGTRMPDWVSAGFQEYAKRLPAECALLLREIEPVRRGKGSDGARAVQEEGRRLLAAIPKGARVIALEVRGTAWDTGQLADQLSGWLRGGSDIALLVGGADGLSDECLTSASERWSLSPLTLPHPLVRILLSEQLYRAWSLLQHHPYHRA